jgi:DNA polymerase-3 subunit alpha
MMWESAGLVKSPGLRTPTIIKWAMETINREQAKQACLI